MKKEYWAHLETMLKEHGFSRVPSQQQGTSIRWFGCAATGADVTAYLRFDSKPTSRILTVHLGWRHDAAYDFFLEALKADWPRGFSWLSEVGVLDAPCVCQFFLGSYMRPAYGISFREPQSFYEEVSRFGELIARSDWGNLNAKGLLARYVTDEKPFGWLSSCSCAIRLALIAGLCANKVGGSEEVFDRCAKTYSKLIEADMASLGTGSSWIAALRTRLLSAIEPVV